MRMRVRQSLRPRQCKADIVCVCVCVCVCMYVAQRLRNPRTAAPVPDAARSAELAGTLLAGHAPLAASLQWALFLLASHPACQEALHTELLASGCVQNPEVLTLDTIGEPQMCVCVCVCQRPNSRDCI